MLIPAINRSELQCIYLDSLIFSFGMLFWYDLKVVLKSEVDFSKKSNFFSNMFYLKVGSVANKKMIKKVYVAVQNFAAAPQKEGWSGAQILIILLHEKKRKISFN